MRRKTRILIVDEASLLRDGLRVLLELEEDLEVMGAIGSGDEFVEAAPKTGPHLVLLEFAMPSQDGWETVAAVKSRWPETRVLILTFRREDEFFEAALRAGADGYLLKTDSRTELLTAIHE